MRALNLAVALVVLALVAGLGDAASTLTAKVFLRITAEPVTTGDLQSVSAPLNYSKTWTFTSGAGANKVQQIWTDSRTLTASTSEELDLAGVLKNYAGETVTFTKIKLIYIVANSANASTLTVGGAASNTFINWVSDSSDSIVIRPDGAVLLMAPDATGYGVTASTGDLLKILNNSGSASATYSIMILGEGTSA
jgi:hypothetical protein